MKSRCDVYVLLAPHTQRSQPCAPLALIAKRLIEPNVGTLSALMRPRVSIPGG